MGETTGERIIVLKDSKLIMIFIFSLPKHLATEVEDNLTKIFDRTENILKATKDQKVKDYIRLIADRVKNLSTVKGTIPQSKIISPPLPPIDNNAELSANQEVVVNSINVPESVVTHVGFIEEESEVMKMLRENSENSTSTCEEAMEEVEFPNIQNSTLKGRILEGGSSESAIVGKKLKYESPLEFLRLPKSNKYEDT